mmetsp:Transcript_12691/g.21835  ORF Transcript_12691/g.21835 Transcript_12691/m.21835 type:complete len:547 (+) Transcript_12691:52-1692(+)
MVVAAEFLIPRLLLGLLLRAAVAVNTTRDGCEPEQWSALQVDNTPMMPTTPQWQKDLQETAELARKHLNEVKEQAGKDLATAKTQKTVDAVNGALTSFNKAYPAIEKCVKAAAGKCDGREMTISIIQSLGELKPLISAISEGAGKFVPLVGAFGQLLALLIGSSPSQPQPPISIKDVRMAVSGELYNFELEKNIWRFKHLMDSLDDRKEIYSAELNSKSLDKMAAWYENVFKVDRGHIMSWVNEIMMGYEGIVGSKSSFRALLAAKKPFKDCHTTRPSFSNTQASVEACAFERDKNKKKACAEEMDQAIASYDRLKMGLEQFKLLGNSMNALAAVVTSIKNTRGCSWEEEGQSAKVAKVESNPSKPKRWSSMWRRKKTSLVVAAPKDYCSAVDSFMKDVKRINDKFKIVEANFKVLDGPSCASKPFVPWALGQKSTTCSGMQNCNYGYLVHTCSQPCADLGLPYFFDSLRDSACKATLNPHKGQPSWAHVFKRSLALDNYLRGESNEKVLCDCPSWPGPARNYLCGERNYCVEQPCLKYFIDASVW